MLKTLLEDNNFVNLIKCNTCFNSKPGSCTDLILTNKPKSLQNTGVMKTGMSDHHVLHVLIFSFLKTIFTKMLSNKLQYRNYKQFEAHSFYKMLDNYPKKLFTQTRKKILWKRETNTLLLKRKWSEETVNLLSKKNWELWNDQLCKRWQMSQKIQK